MPELRPTTNCGTYELNGIREFHPRHATHFFTRLHEAEEANYRARGGAYSRRQWKTPGIILFSDAKGSRKILPTKGEIFAQFIEDNNLGTVTSSQWTRNPNTGNKIKFWIWNTNEAVLRRFG